VVRNVRDILWERRGNPTPWVSRQLGIEEWQLRDAIHRIKDRSGLSGADRLIIHRNGDVTDEHGEDLGNVHDEV
jgi:hypothetical protein